ncbi:hypothetical protein LY78DRAFT_665289 [Colletotrichum sublineola]|nr:hypothetical protein LY78DRAFT_665289 [Colletotrichum sublineola]
MLAKAALLVTLGAFASAQTFVGFPSSLTCKTSNGTATISMSESQNAILGPKGFKVEDNAANMASGKCSTLSGIPLFAIYSSFPAFQTSSRDIEPWAVQQVDA